MIQIIQCISFILKANHKKLYLLTIVYSPLLYFADVNFGPVNFCNFLKISFQLQFLVVLPECEIPFLFTDCDGWKRRADRTQIKGTTYSALGKNSANLLTRAPPVQPVHGRVDWAAKYGSHR